MQKHNIEIALLLCPSRDQSWRWKTSSNEIGKFNLIQHREALKREELHKACSRKNEELSNALRDAKATLEMFKLGYYSKNCIAHWGGAGAGDDHQQGKCSLAGTFFGSPRLGICDCINKPHAPCNNPFRTTSELEYNGARRPEYRLLDDHVKSEHPRLVKRLQHNLSMSMLPKDPYVEM
ncbi:unnamed protein product [Sphagnum jensenii]|uniref:Uncharacterized protein n=1 Tax=Sphagnum jensenii TaxID=128206 RepID=A0ABP0WTF6_9BRYO